MTRICITGGPRTGKTTLLRQLMETERIAVGCSFHTDDLIEQCKHLGREAWSEASHIASTWLDEPGPWIIEGVAVSRALRKWWEANRLDRPPVDRVIYLRSPHQALSNGQQRMAIGVRTVHDEIEPWLAEHGIVTEYR